MTGIKRTGAMIIAALCFVTLLQAAPRKALGETGWTVLVYMVGSDLESEHGLGTADLREMQEAVREDTTLLVMTGGSPAWSDPQIPGDACTVWRVERGGMREVSCTQGSMGDAGTLRAFLEQAAGADGPVMLIFWDHGYGPMEGFGKDDTSGGGRLTLAEIREALEGCFGEDRRLALVGFDACMMASCETALALRPWAEYLAASQETEPPEGWNYGFLADLAPDTDGRRAGELIVEEYTGFYQQLYSAYPLYAYPYTLSLVRLDGAGKLGEAAGGLLEVLGGDLGSGRFSEISRRRNGAWTFGKLSTPTEYDLIDLREMAGQWQAEYPEQAGAVLGALDSCVLASSGNQEKAGGLSVYFPQFAGRGERDRWRGALDSLPVGDGWKGFVRAYEAVLDGEPEESAAGGEAARAELELTDEQLRDFASARYFVVAESENGYRLVYAGQDCTLEDHTVRAEYRGQMLVLESEGKNCPLTAFYLQEDSRAAYYRSFAIAVQMAEDVPKMTVVMLRIVRDEATGEWMVISATDRSEELVTGRQEVDLAAQDELIVGTGYYTPTEDGKGNVLPYTQWTHTGVSAIEEMSTRGGFRLYEGDLRLEEGETAWIQLVIRDTRNRDYAAPMVRLDAASGR